MFVVLIFHNVILLKWNHQKHRKRKNKTFSKEIKRNSFCLEKQNPYKVFPFPYVLRHNVTVIIYKFSWYFLKGEFEILSFQFRIKIEIEFSLKFYFMFQLCFDFPRFLERMKMKIFWCLRKLILQGCELDFIQDTRNIKQLRIIYNYFQQFS